MTEVVRAHWATGSTSTSIVLSGVELMVPPVMAFTTVTRVGKSKGPLKRGGGRISRFVRLPAGTLRMPPTKLFGSAVRSTPLRMILVLFGAPARLNSRNSCSSGPGVLSAVSPTTEEDKLKVEPSGNWMLRGVGTTTTVMFPVSVAVLLATWSGPVALSVVMTSTWS